LSSGVPGSTTLFWDILNGCLFQISVLLSCYSYWLYQIKKCDAAEANYGVRIKLISQFESEIGNMDRHKHTWLSHETVCHVTNEDRLKIRVSFDKFRNDDQYSEANVMHFLFNLLRIKGLYMFRALLAHPQEALHFNPGAANWHNTHAIYQVPLVQRLLKMSK
jgi:hypothetical protein